MKKFILCIAAIVYFIAADAQVGIGTNSPNTNAILDISSANKAVIFPRLVDTSNVANPIEGMMIYNKHTKAPFFHDGNKWLSLGARLPSVQPTAGAVIKYLVTAPGFSATEEEANSGQVGAGFGVSFNATSPSSASEFVFTKQLDINSKAFNLATLVSGGPYTSIEFKFYALDASVPYLSYRFKNVYFSGYSVSSGGDRPSESISVFYENYGFKDWVNNLEFGYNVNTHIVTSY